MFLHTILVREDVNRRNSTGLISYDNRVGLILAEHSMLDENLHSNVFIGRSPGAKYREQGETGS
jgi:hypothetical protein